MLYFVYILQSTKDKGLYTGFTKNLKTRLKRHNYGLVTSTKKRKPLKLIYFEAFSNKYDALSREKYLKSGYGNKQIKQILKQTLKNQ